MNQIEKYYNKFNEDKRLSTRHGQIEFTVSMSFIQKYIGGKICKIIDIGAGTGKYSIALSNNGHDVTAIELVKKNLSMLQQKNSNVKAYQGNALNLKKFKDETYDITIMFGPMYHLFSTQDKVQALKEAKRVTKKGGYIFVAYLLADYALIRHGIMDNNIHSSLETGKIDDNYNIISTPDDLYSYIRLPQIDEYNSLAGLTRKTIFSPDGATDYIRPYINKLSQEDFEYFVNYQIANAERIDLLGASSHVVDVLIKE